MSAEFTFVFVEMGQGDCCMVKCPDGQVLVVDCGSTNMTEINQNYMVEAQELLRTWVSSQKNKIAALVLTHPDIDHHNQVVDFFSEVEYMGSWTLPTTGTILEDPKIAHCDIDRIFFSNSAGDNSPLGNYTYGKLYKNKYGLNNNVYAGNFNTNEIHEVTINNAELFTTLSAGFTQPALNATVVATIKVTSWLAEGQTVYISVGGYYSVQKIDKYDPTQVTLLNLEYAGNAAPAATVPSGGTVTQKNYYKTWKKADNFEKPATITQITNKRLNLFVGNTDGKAWSVSVIAGNVPNGYGGVKDYATEDNAKSLVTLFEVAGKKALLTGDSTFSTEEFLCTIHKNLLTNLDLAQVPHHGSSYASKKLLVDTVNPKAAVTSVGFLEHAYRLPWYEDVLDRWLQAVEANHANIPDHDLDYWYGKNESTKKDLTHAELDQKLDEWTNNRTDFSRVDCNTSRNFWYLRAPENGIIALYALTKVGYFLYRETVNSNLCQTSQKTQTYTLSDTGVTYKG